MIDIKGINKIIQEKMLFNDVTMSIELSSKIAIVGPNGNGKTTFLNLVSKNDVPTSGTITYSKKCKIGYLNQHNNITEDNVTSEQYLNEALTEVNELSNKIKHYEKMMENNYDEKILVKYTNALEMFNNVGGYEIEALINKTCDQLNINKQILNTNFNDLSNGQKKIIELAKIILSKPNVLILDEPTNHLDFEKISIVETFINNFNGAVILVSHDREFINNTCNSIIEIKNGSFNTYSGNYDFYIKEKGIENNNLVKSFYEQKKEIARLKRLARQYRTWAQIGDNEKFYKLAKKAEKQLEEMDKIKLDKKLKEDLMEFSNVSRIGDEVLIIKNLNIGYDNVSLIKDINIEIYRGDKVCIIGENGCGKSTFIKYIINNLDNDIENIKYGDNIKLGVIEQEVKFKNENQTIYEYCKDFIFKEESKIRSILHNYDFTTEFINKKLNVLSGGQRVRLKLLKQIYLNVNLLIMDEPTNHLDIVTCELLEKSLQSYDGTLIFISHDRYFINKIASTIFRIDNNNINEVDGIVNIKK